MSKPSPRKRAKMLKRQKSKENHARERARSKKPTVQNAPNSPPITDKSYTRIVYKDASPSLVSFPEVQFDCQGPETLVAFVKDQIGEIIKDRENLIPSGMLFAFGIAARDGFKLAFESIRQANESLQPGSFDGHLHSPMQMQFNMILGALLFSRFPADFWNRYFPFSDVRIDLGVPVSRAITVRIRTIRSVATPGGRGYLPKKSPCVEINGERLAVGFYRHAAERICHRCVINWKSYGGLGDAFALLNDCSYYEPYVFRDGEPGFIVYDMATPGFVQWDYASLLEDGGTGKKMIYYRAGYCPSVRHGSHLIAKTLLTPGMRGTPERAWAQNNLSRRELSDLDAAVSTIEESRESLPDYLRVMKPIHQASPSLKQVVNFDRHIFDYGDL